MWLKIITENYCKQLFAKRIATDDNNDVTSDRFDNEDESFLENTRKLDMEDLQKVLAIMPNQRYHRLIELRYVDEKTNEEVAQILGLEMKNYYNSHKRAKEQFCDAMRKEGLL